MENTNTYVHEFRKIFNKEQYTKQTGIQSLLTINGLANLSAFWILHGKPDKMQLKDLMENGFNENATIKLLMVLTILFGISVSSNICNPFVEFITNITYYIATSIIQSKMGRFFYPWEECFFWLICCFGVSLLLHTRTNYIKLLRDTSIQAVKKTFIAMVYSVVQQYIADDVLFDHVDNILEIGSQGAQQMNQTLNKQVLKNAKKQYKH